MSWRDASRSSTSAPSGAVAATASVNLNRLRPQDPEGLAPRLGGRPVDDQDPVQVVELVLADPRRQPFELEAHVLALGVRRLDRRPLVPLARARDGLPRQAPFVVRESLPRPLG